MEGEVEVVEVGHDVEEDVARGVGHDGARELIADEEEDGVADEEKEEKADELGELTVGFGVGEFGEAGGEEGGEAVTNSAGSDGEKSADGEVGATDEVVEEGFEGFHRWGLGCGLGGRLGGVVFYNVYLFYLLEEFKTGDYSMNGEILQDYKSKFFWWGAGEVSVYNDG